MGGYTTTSGGGTSLTGLGTDNRLARWDGTDTIQSSGVTLDDTDNMTGLVSLTFNLTQDYLFTEFSNNLAIQGQTAATAAVVGLFSNDGDGTDGVGLNLFGVGTPSSFTNRERLITQWNQATSQYEILTENNGTGTLRDLSIYTLGNTDQFKLNADGSIELTTASGSDVICTLGGEGTLSVISSATTDNGLDVAVNSLTSGKGIDISCSNNSITGAALFSTTATATAADTNFTGLLQNNNIVRTVTGAITLTDQSTAGSFQKILTVNNGSATLNDLANVVDINTILTETAGTIDYQGHLLAISGTGTGYNASSHALDITFVGSGATIAAQNTNGGATGVILETHHNSISPADLDVIARHSYFGEDSASNKQEYARIDVIANGTTSGSEVGEFSFQVDNAGSLEEVVSLSYNDGLKVSKRLQMIQGADVASATNLALGADGNTFEITGTTQIDLIDNTDWQNGSVVILLFTAALTVSDAVATSGSNTTILLDGSADFSTSAGGTLTLLLSEIGGTQAWREIGRSAL